MATRELWLNIMHYGSFDRMPVIHWGAWNETKERWIQEGMPKDVDEHAYFDAAPFWTIVIPKHNGLYPAFERQVLEETDEHLLVRGADGVIQQESKHTSCIPHYVDFTFKTAKDWPEYKKRLQPDPARIQDNLDYIIAKAENSGLPVGVGIPSMMGWTRNWMGVENMAYLMNDDPDVYADIVNTLADLACWELDRIIPRMHRPPDIGCGWEDICGRSGPFVSPAVFDKCVAPGYRKIRQHLEHYGVKLFGVDCDGYIEPLVRNWLDAGVNVLFPMEIGAWNADPMQLRRKFGRELRIIGGFNKMEMEKGPSAIDAEIERRLPLMKEGGYVMLTDHLVTPGTSLSNCKYYLERIRKLRF